MQTKRTIIFDLDGTLIKISKRYYHVYKEIILSLDKKPLNKKEYWDLKRNGVNFHKILLQSCVFGNEEELFLQKYIQEIEDWKNLRYDTVFRNTHQILHQLRKDYNLYLITLRRSISNTSHQLEDLNLKNMFIDIVTADEEAINKKSKKHLIKNLIGNKKAIIIGDSESELVAASELKLPSIALFSGIRNSEFLSRLKPTYIVRDISKVISILDLVY